MSTFISNHRFSSHSPKESRVSMPAREQAISLTGSFVSSQVTWQVRAIRAFGYFAFNFRSFVLARLILFLLLWHGSL